MMLLIILTSAKFIFVIDIDNIIINDNDVIRWTSKTSSPIQ